MKVTECISLTKSEIERLKNDSSGEWDKKKGQLKTKLDELNFRLHFLNWLECENIQEVEEEFQFNKERKFRFDFYFSKQKIGIDLHGLTHFSYHSAIKNDLEKIIEAQKAGYKYFIFATNCRNYELILDLIK